MLIAPRIEPKTLVDRFKTLLGLAPERPPYQPVDPSLSRHRVLQERKETAYQFQKGLIALERYQNQNKE